jgi:hypothetical protein
MCVPQGMSAMTWMPVFRSAEAAEDETQALAVVFPTAGTFPAALADSPGTGRWNLQGHGLAGERRMPIGTGGAVLDARQFLQDRFLIGP